MTFPLPALQAIPTPVLRTHGTLPTSQLLTILMALYSENYQRSMTLCFSLKLSFGPLAQSTILPKHFAL
jgi:hypothetical protein